MRARLLQFLEALHSSYWFVPTLMALAAIAMALVTTSIDGWLGSEWMDRVTWLYANKPDGARAFLSTVAGSMITVAGVTFSITIASFVYASSQFGPRLLTNFMRDRGNQITLGTFIATFLYCLLVLRTVRSAGEPADLALEPAGAAAAFVPHLSLLVGLLLALASLGVFIYFIHHIPDGIHVSNVVAEIGRELNASLDRLFPHAFGTAETHSVRPPEHYLPDGFFEDAVPVPADGDGYIQNLDSGGLLKTAVRHDLLLRVEYRPGDFVTEGKTLVLAWPAAHVGEHVKHSIRGAFAWGRRRTQAQDVMFLVNELVEIAARALSPGVNDPFTAISCMDWLSSAISRMAQRRLPEALRRDEQGMLRVVAHPITFESFTAAIFDQLRPYASKDRNAALHLLKVFGEVAGDLATDAQRRHLLNRARELREACRAALDQDADLQAVDERFAAARRLLAGTTRPATEADRHRWLGGSA